MALAVRLETDRDSGVRMAAARSLGQVGVAAKEVVVALTRAANDPEPEVRIRAAKSLSQITDDPKIIVPALVACLASRDQPARYQAATALAKMGSEAQDALPALQKLARAPGTSASVRDVVEQAIAEIQRQLPTTAPQESTHR